MTLQEDSKILDEVVVIGYGTSKRSDLTGSVVSVKNEVDSFGGDIEFSVLLPRL